ncbi:unnamed protein product [Paramecium sonneborni]|uniref:Transmembrane protein n=1 Tax=Paramecium sonneborni TaxID=65129 RepID=A0A8S1NVM5_9CILI|nr:unnamed protein product [Paramecium sonneborni]
MSDIGVTIIKILNAGSAIVLAFAGVWIIISQLIHGNFNIFSFLYPCFFIFFGFLLVANEIKFGNVLKEYGFLKTFLGRGLFYIFLSSQVCYAYFSIASNHVAGDIYGTVFFILGVFYLLLNFYVIYILIFFIAKGIIGKYFKSIIFICQISLCKCNEKFFDIIQIYKINKILQIIYVITQQQQKYQYGIKTTIKNQILVLNYQSEFRILIQCCQDNTK